MPDFNAKVTVDIPATVTVAQLVDVMEIWEQNAGYWETPFRRHKYQKNESGEKQLISVEVECVDQRGLGVNIDGKWWQIDINTVLAGLNLIAARDDITNCRDQIIALLGSGEIDMVDFDQADAIVQAGLFGQLVYG